MKNQKECRTNRICTACKSSKLGFYSHPLYKRCANCGSIIQTENIFAIKDYYKNRRMDFSHQRGSYKTYLEIISKHIDCKKYFLIDIGAGDDTFLSEALKFPFKNIYGYDISPTAIKYLREKNYYCDISKIRMLKPKVVTAFQVLEHLHSPREFLNSFGFRKGDIIVLTSPGVDSPTAQKKHKNGNWISLSPSHHLCLYSKKGISILLSDCGFSLLYYNYIWAACHGTLDNLKKYFITLMKWAIKIILGRQNKFPSFYWKNSFIVIAKKISNE
jgi:hypothetical protein